MGERRRRGTQGEAPKVRPKWAPEGVGPRRGGAPKGGAPKGAPEGGEPNIFALFPPPDKIFFLSSLGLLVDFFF